MFSIHHMNYISILYFPLIAGILCASVVLWLRTMIAYVPWFCNYYEIWTLEFSLLYLFFRFTSQQWNTIPECIMKENYTFWNFGVIVWGRKYLRGTFCFTFIIPIDVLDNGYLNWWLGVNLMFINICFQNQQVIN